MKILLDAAFVGVLLYVSICDWKTMEIPNKCHGIILLLGVLVVPPFRSLLIQFCIFPTVRRLMIDPYYRDNPHADKQARLDLNLDVEETEQTPEEPVFSDERPAEPEPTTFPKQYDERELRRFNARRTHAGDEEDNTI